jgi:hypothetical protein
MENQPPFSNNASAWLNRKPAAPDDNDAELTRLKDRLGFYESFDSLIQENVSRASELLRHAATMRENAEQELAQARRELEELRLGDRQEYRSLLSGMLDEVTTMQVQIERLARRVSDALDDLETSLPAGSEIGRIAATGSASATEYDGQTAQQAPSLSLDPTPEEVGPPEPEGEAEFRGLVAPEVDVAEADVVFAEASETVVQIGEDSAQAAETSVETAGAIDGQESAHPESDRRPQAAESTNVDSNLIVDEIVQPPAEETAAEPAEQEEPRAQAEMGDDGVINDAAPAETSEPSSMAAVESAPPAAVADELSIAPDTASTPVEGGPAEPAPSRLPWISADARPFSMEGIGGSVRRPGTGELRTPEASPRPAPSSAPSPAGHGIATAVLVHGVPRATTALSLKRFLEGLPHVAAVEPREYAEGILRLHVTGERSLLIDDLRGWSDGSGLEPVHLRDDLIEVRLPT